MKSRETALRAKRFEVNEKARKAADLEMMVREFETMAADLERQVQVEEDRTGVKDPSHFSYSTFAKSARQRRENLIASVAELRAKLEVAQKECDEAKEQFTL
ncbi:MAG: flagellar export protein FliJ, partial [Gammaproteobacteria bacterium]